jgi:catechol 2,3-dioxygenase-like lactoylglutathione lyase family enzyme
VNVQFIASMAVIAPDPAESRKLYVDTLGLPLEASAGDDYFHSEHIGGSKHFGVWPLTQAAQACFGAPGWPDDQPVPQAAVEFEVGSPEAVQAAADELRAGGFTLLHDARTEPWGQTVARLQSPEGEEDPRLGSLVRRAPDVRCLAEATRRSLRTSAEGEEQSGAGVD